MLFANISIAEKYNYLDDKFKAAYAWLKETDLQSLSVGAYKIMGDDVIANVQEYTTIPADTAFFETHEKYFDMQYIISGREMFGICKRDGLVEKERIAEKDLIFYHEPEDSGVALLEEGDLIIVAPEDAHKPKGMVKEPGEVKKIVIKVSV